MNYLPKFNKSLSTKHMSLQDNQLNANNHQINRNNSLHKYLNSKSIHDKEYRFNNMRYLEGSHSKIDASHRNGLNMIDKNRFNTI